MIIILLFLISACQKAPQNDTSDPRKKYSAEMLELDTPEPGKLPYFAADTRPFWSSNVQEIQGNALMVQPFLFTNQAGRNFGDQDLKGKITVVSFFFTRCRDYCPRLIEKLRPVQASFRNVPNVQLVGYSVTPDLDTIAVLKDYSEKKEINGQNWHLLTGPKKEIYELARVSFKADRERRELTENDFLHSENVYLVDGGLHIRGIYNGDSTSSLQGMIADIETLLKSSGPDIL
ncbi:MAG: SCO family protein [Spirochaetales bacterium]|nr:SCO family protein [Spirochaetales bacterium]